MHELQRRERGSGIERRDHLAVLVVESSQRQLQCDLQPEPSRERHPAESQIVEGGQTLAMIRSRKPQLARPAQECQGPRQRPERARHRAVLAQLEHVHSRARMPQRQLDGAVPIVPAIALSGGASFVAMVQSADLRYRHD